MERNGMRPHQTLSRRSLLQVAAGLSLTTLLAACGGSSNDKAPTAGAAQNSSAPTTSSSSSSGSAPAPTSATSSATAASQPKTGGVLRYGIVNDPASMDPHAFSGAAADALYGIVYNRLVRYQKDWKIEGDLADSWDVQNDKVYTFKLRDGVKFHDGTAMTADDVKFSVDRIMDEKTGGYVRPLIVSSFDKAEVVDPKTVRITLKEVNAAFLAALALPTASIVSKKYVEGGGDLKTTMMGTGPFKFISRQPNVEIKLQKHTEYFETGKPYLDGITIIPLPDDTARTTGLRSGSVDYIDFIPWKDMSTLSSDSKFKVYSDTESSGLWMFMKTNLKPMDNAAVRVALNNAIDRKAITQSAFFGHGAPMADIFVPKSSWAYVPDLQGGYTYQADKAKQALGDASAAGFPVRFVSTNEVLIHKSAAEVVDANLRAIGVKVNLQMQDWATTVKMQNTGDYEMIMWGGGPLYGDPDYLSGYFKTGSSVPKLTGYSNPDLDKLLDSARQTLDPTERLKFYRQAYDIILKEAPWIPLAYREQGEAAAVYVKGYERVLGSNWNGYRVAMTWFDK